MEKKILAFIISIIFATSSTVSALAADEMMVVEEKETEAEIVAEDVISVEEDTEIENAGATEGDFEYYVDSVNELAILTGFTGNYSEVVVPDRLGGFPVEKIKEEVFRSNKVIEKVVLSDNVKEISESAFSNCENLQFVYLSANLTHIPSDAFSGCSMLASINVPIGVKGIGSSAFRGCESLSTIQLPDGLLELGKNCFKECMQLTAINIPDTVRQMGSSCFEDCASLASINLSQNLSEIYSSTFQECINLSFIEIPPNIKKIYSYAFAKAGLKEIILNEGLREVSGDAFDYTPLEEIIIPETVEKIHGGSREFTGCDFLQRIVFMGNTYLDSYAFYSNEITPDIYALANSYAYHSAMESGLNFYKINPPTELQAKNVDDTSVEIKWNQVNYIEGYEVYRSTKLDGAYEKIADTTSNSCVDDTLDLEHDYFYKVRVYYNHGSKVNGVFSQPVKREVKLISDAAVSYEAKQFYTGKQVTPELVISYKGKRIQEGTDYELIYQDNIDIGNAVIRIIGKGDYLGEKIIEFSIAQFGEPKLKAAVSQTYNSIKISWNTVKGATGYNVMRKQDGQWVLAGKSKSGSFIDKGLSYGKTYTYTVQAYRKQGNDVAESGYNKKGLKAKTALAQPKITSISSSKYGKITIKWSKVAGASGYYLYRSSTKNGTYKKIKDINRGTTVKYVNTGLGNFKPYYYKVRAYRVVAGKKVFSKYSAIRGKRTPAKDIYGTYKDGEGNQITLKKFSGYNAKGDKCIGKMTMKYPDGTSWSGYIGGVVPGEYIQVLSEGSKVVALLRPKTTGMTVEFRYNMDVYVWYRRIK